MANDETRNMTTRFKVDLSQYKKGLSEANKSMRLTNAEFKAATAGLDKVDDKMEILSLTINKFKSNLTDESSKLEILKKQQDDTSKKYEESKKTLEKLNQEYQSVVKNQGASSQSAKDLKKQIDSLIETQYKNQKSSEDLSIKILNQEATVNKLKKQIKDAEKEYSNFDNEVKETNESVDKLNETTAKSTEGFTIAKGVISNLATDGIKKLSQSALDGAKNITKMADDYNVSMDRLQAKTNASTMEISNFKKIVTELYSENYGNGFEDLTDSLGIVVQYSKEVDPSKIKDLTKNAIALRDVFNFEIGETLRTVNMLMEQFQISGEEAFNVIAKGAQEGLDKNGDLLDTLNEYAVHYKQLGFNVNEFLASLKNGTDSGTFSVDKLGDAVKEFGIRAKDTANATTEGFQIIGLNADKMRKKFAQGGETAKSAMFETVNALMNVKDQVKQNQAGVDLFGTMWEDLGIKGVKGLTNIEYSFDDLNTTMKKINEISYQGIQNDMKEAGRTIQTDIILPIGQKLLPTLNKYVKEYAPKIKSSMDYIIKNGKTIVKVVGSVGGVVLTYNATVKTTTTLIKAATTAQMAYNVIMKTLKKSTEAQTVAQVALNTAQKASIVGLITAGTVALGLATYELVNHMKNQRNAHQQLSEEIKKEKEQIAELEEAKQIQISSQMSEINHIQNLKNELDTLIDSNGHLKEGYENRAKFILNELSTALNQEITLNDILNGKYENLSNSVDEMISKKKANILLEASEEQYVKAIENQTQATKEALKYKNELTKAEKEYNKAIYENDIQNTESSKKSLQTAYNNYLTKKKYYEEEKNIVQTYQAQIASYEDLAAAIASGNTERIEKAINDRNIAYQKGKETVSTTLAEQIATQNYYSESYKSLLDKDVQNGIDAENSKYQVQVESSKKRLEQLIQDLISQTSTINDNSPEVVNAWKTLYNSSRATFNETVGKLPKDVQKILAEMGLIAKNEKGEVINQFDDMAKKSTETLDKHQAQFVAAGENSISGINQGLNNKKSGLFSNIAGIASGMISTMVGNLGIHSPSTKFRDRVGKFINPGIAEGILSNIHVVKNALKKVSKDALNESSLMKNKFSLQLDNFNYYENFDKNFLKLKGGFLENSYDKRNEIRNINNNQNHSVSNQNITVNQYIQNIPQTQLEIYKQTKAALKKVNGGNIYVSVGGGKR